MKKKLKVYACVHRAARVCITTVQIKKTKGAVASASCKPKPREKPKIVTAFAVNQM